MKIKKLYLSIIVAGIILTIGGISCDKNLDKSDPNTVTVDQYFKNSTELLSGTNAVYSTMHGGNLVGREWFFLHDTRSDEVATGGSQLEVPRAQLLNGVQDPSNAVLNSVWDALYTLIHRANTVIANGPIVTDNTQLRDRCVGEAKFLRAWAYFDLLSQWGGVPINIAPVTTADAYQPRSKEDDVYTLIIQDLNDAIAALPPSYAPSDLGRATSGAANTLLGRVLMLKGDYAGAKTALLKVTGYTLTDRYLDNFEEETEFNKESIFEAIYVDKGDNNFNWGGNGVGDGPTADQTTVRNQEYNPIAWRNLIPSNKYLNEFENTSTGAAKTDPRYKFSTYESGDVYNSGASILMDDDVQGSLSIVNGVTKKVSWRKFMLIYKESKAQAGFHPGSNNQRLIRYADVLLMLAECENEAGNIPGALGYLNQIRDRASVAMPHYPTAQFPTATKDDVTRAIMHERIVELGDEEVRNIDITRWRKRGYYPSVLPEPLSYFMANKQELLPIPQSEIDNNPKLGTGDVPKQNPGY